MLSNNKKSNSSKKKSKNKIVDSKTKVMPVAKQKKKKDLKKNGVDKDNTKIINTNKKGVKEKGKKQKFSKKHPIFMNIVRICIIIGLLGAIVGAGIFAGIFFGLFGDEFDITQEQLTIGVSNSVIVDQNGNVITSLSGDEKRKTITLEEMSEYLPKAYVSIEDERFNEHSGVDIRRTGGAIVNTLLGNSGYGGSTITQQLVKNITGDDEAGGLNGIYRKIREWSKAYQVERMISKDQILELYLNILYIGGEGNLHGVELGAEYYFSKSAKDLDLAECAFLAGINTSPSLYNPYILHQAFDSEEERNERIKEKTLTVLAKMKELGEINSDEEYDVAVAKVEAGLPFVKGTSSIVSSYSYHTDAVIEQVINQVMSEKDVTRQIAENYVYSSGLTIYSTVNPDIQTKIEAEYAKSKYEIAGREKNGDGTLKNETSESAFVLIDHKTGHVIGVAGGLGAKTLTDQNNRATQALRQPGSTIKPIADLAPALEEKIIQTSTVYHDVKSTFNGSYEPKNDGNSYRGFINIRTILAFSQNIPQVKIMTELTPAKSIEYLRKFGISTLVDSSENPAHNDEILPLALGGISKGISPLEMAAAYATIANGGEYITPIFYTKVVDEEENVVLAPNQEKTRVISQQNAYIMQSILTEPLKQGYIGYLSIPGITVGAKTGTTDASKDRWLCGFTPYYTATTWYGYDNPETVIYNASSNPAAQIWDSIMTQIHTGLAAAVFERPTGIVEASVCRDTGTLAVQTCKNVYTEIFSSDNLPQKCQGHGSQEICKLSGKVANVHCLEKEQVIFGGIVPKEQLTLWTPNKAMSGKKEIMEICDKCKEVIEPEPEPEPEPVPVPEPKPDPKPEPKPDPKPEPEPVPIPKPESEPEN